MNIKIFFTVFLISTITGLNCKNNKASNSNGNADDSIFSQNQAMELIFETDAQHKSGFKPGEVPLIKIRQKENIIIDSVEVYFNRKKINVLKLIPAELKIEEKIEKLGQFDLETHAFYKGKTAIQKFPITFLSNIEPQIFGYEVVKVFPHDRKAYTQGLVYEDGFLYESNGMKNESTLRKLQIGTGEPIQSYTLPAEIFAEGLTIVGDKLIQISWQNFTGFVYNKKTFELVAKFSYSTEGWGLTNDGKNIIMSDGTNRLYFLDTETYTEVNRIEVYDNKGPVNELNELEYINGEIYANIYRSDKIAKINPGSGKVMAYIDLSNLLGEKDKDGTTDVLNGIAYDTSGKRLFVTGKRWPKMFEIKLIPKNK